MGEWYLTNAASSTATTDGRGRTRCQPCSRPGTAVQTLRAGRGLLKRIQASSEREGGDEGTTTDLQEQGFPALLKREERN
jgi:hypothetical protein